jgi:hypothetical protein
MQDLQIFVFNTLRDYMYYLENCMYTIAGIGTLTKRPRTKRPRT